MQHGDQWRRLGLGEAHHNNIIDLRGWLLNALKISKKGADLRPHSGIELPKSFQVQGIFAPLAP